MRRISYRIRQFWRALRETPAEEQLNQARQTLTPELYSLFRQLQPFEQAHALQMYETLRTQGDQNKTLLVAVLLHDVGKVRLPLNPWERALAVAGNKLFHRAAKRIGQGQAKGWRRSFVVTEQHAQWGAEMAAEAGASPEVVRLIAIHQEKEPEGLSIEERIWLKALQRVDDAY